MLLVMTFENEFMPFMMHDSDDECLRAIELAKKDYRFNRATAIVKDDFVYLETFKKKRPKYRIYCKDDKEILRTDADLPEEVGPTKELLAHELKGSIKEIQAVEI